MKKLSVILLVLALAMTSVFADFSVALGGYVEADYAVDLENGTFKYVAPDTSAIKVTFGYAVDPKSYVGEGLRAELTAKLAFTAANYGAGAFATSKTLAEVGTFKLSLANFDIKYKDLWALDLTEAAAVGNFATSTIDAIKYYYSATTTYEGTYADDYYFYTDNGVTFTWNGFTFAAAVDGDWKDVNEDLIYTGVETPDFTLGNFKLQGAGAFSYKGSVRSQYDSWMVAGSLKAAFQNDKMSFEAATDNAITFGYNPVVGAALEGYTVPATKEAAKVRYDVDAKLAAKFNLATVDVFFAKNATGSYVNALGIQVQNSFKNLLSAKAVFDLSCYNTPLKATFTGLNLLNEAKILSTDFQFTFAEKYVLKAYAYDLLTTEKKVAELDAKELAAQKKYYTDNGAGQKLGLGTELTFGPVDIAADVYSRVAYKSIGFGIGAEYTHNYFVATADVDAEFVAGSKASEKGIVTVAAGVESDNIIQNATVGIAYASDNLLPASYQTFDLSGKVAATEHGLGTVTASVTVTF